MLSKRFKTVSVAVVVLMLPQLVWAQTQWDVRGVKQSEFWLPSQPADESPSVSVFKPKQLSSDVMQVGLKQKQAQGLMPVEAKATSKYGRRLHPVSKRYKMHQGDDYAAPMGTPILAPSAGVVTFVGRKGGYGNTVMLRHNERKETLYAHMSRYGENVQVGKVIQAGQTIGYVGSTGISTGPHLHFEVWRDGKRVNPSSAQLPQLPLAEEQAHILRTQSQPKVKSSVPTIQL